MLWCRLKNECRQRCCTHKSRYSRDIEINSRAAWYLIFFFTLSDVMTLMCWYKDIHQQAMEEKIITTNLGRLWTNRLVQYWGKTKFNQALELCLELVRKLVHLPWSYCKSQNSIGLIILNYIEETSNLKADKIQAFYKVALKCYFGAPSGERHSNLFWYHLNCVMHHTYDVCQFKR